MLTAVCAYQADAAFVVLFFSPCILFFKLCCGWARLLNVDITSGQTSATFIPLGALCLLFCFFGFLCWIFFHTLQIWIIKDKVMKYCPIKRGNGPVTETE